MQSLILPVRTLRLCGREAKGGDWRETGHELGAGFSYVTTFQKEIPRSLDSEPGLPGHPELVYVMMRRWGTPHNVLAWFIASNV